MKQTYWIKLYVEMLSDPKVAKLEDSAWRKFVELLLLAGDTAEGGFLPPVADMAWLLHTADETMQSMLSRLANAGLLELKVDADGKERWYVSKFGERQRPSPAAERMRQYRERKKKEPKKKERAEKRREDTYTDTDTYRTVTHVTKSNARVTATEAGSAGEENPYWQMDPALRADPEFCQAWRDWLLYVDEAGFNFTPTQAQRLLSEELAVDGPAAASRKIHESIKRGWRSIYEPLTRPTPQQAVTDVMAVLSAD